MHICVTYVDAATGVPCTESPMTQGPALPLVKGLKVVWADKSMWPTNTPLFYGTCDKSADVSIPGVLKVCSSQEYEDLRQKEMERQAEILRQIIVSATQTKLDLFAQTRGYDGILSACTYASSTIEKFQVEGQYCTQARDLTWAKLYEILSEIEAGARPVPEGFSDIEPELPVLTWPE